MSSTAVVVTTLVVYQLCLLGVGFWARSRAQSASGYLIGDYQLGPWIASLSYAAGSSSAWSILGVSGIAFSQGLSAFWLLPGTLTGHLIVWFVLAPKLQSRAKQAGWVTLTDVITQGLSLSDRQLTARIAAGVILFSFTFYVAAQFQGAANTFTAVFEVDFMVALLIGVAVVLTYTLWGGFWAVSITDALQAGLMLLASILLPSVALISIGGFDTLFAVADNESAYWSWAGGHEGWFVVGFFLGMLSIGFGPLGQPHLLNRIMALKHHKDIARARLITLVWFVIVLGGMFLLGLVGHHMMVQTSGEQVFFALADQLLPPVLTGVLIAAVLSAIMSTADSQLLVAGGALQNDLNIAADRLSGAAVARLAVVGVALGATGLALFLPESIFSRVLFAWNALGAAFGPVLLTRLWHWQLPAWSIPAAITTGFGLTVIFYSLPNGPGDLWERALPFVCGVLLLVIARHRQAQIAKAF